MIAVCGAMNTIIGHYKLLSYYTTTHTSIHTWGAIAMASTDVEQQPEENLTTTGKLTS